MCNYWEVHDCRWNMHLLNTAWIHGPNSYYWEGEGKYNSILGFLSTFFFLHQLKWSIQLSKTPLFLGTFSSVGTITKPNIISNVFFSDRIVISLSAINISLWQVHGNNQYLKGKADNVTHCHLVQNQINLLFSSHQHPLSWQTLLTRTHDSGITSTNLCHLQNIAFLLHYRQTWSKLTWCLCSHNSQSCSVCAAAHAIVHCFWYPMQLDSNSNSWQLFAAAWAAVRSMTTMLLWTWKAIWTFCFLFVL